MPQKRAYIGKGVKPQVLEESPSSALSLTPTLEDELEERYVSLENCDMREVDTRISLLSRIILEAVLRSKGELTRKEKGEFALRCIQTLEGARTKGEMVVEQRPITLSVEEYTKEREQVEERLRKLLQHKEHSRVAATEALTALGVKVEEA